MSPRKFLRLSEDQMLSQLEAFIRESFHASRLPNPDYRVTHYYGPQWNCCGALYWYEFRGVVYAVIEHGTICSFSRTGIDLEPFKRREFNRSGI